MQIKLWVVSGDNFASVVDWVRLDEDLLSPQVWKRHEVGVRERRGGRGGHCLLIYWPCDFMREPFFTPPQQLLRRNLLPVASVAEVALALCTSGEG